MLDWAEIKANYGTDFPTDYKEFVSSYGSGTIDESLTVRIPGGRAPSAPQGGWKYVGRFPERTVRNPAMQEWRYAAPADRYPLDRMLIWGETSSADILCWVAVDVNPDRWPVAVWARHVGGWSTYECGMVQFLTGILTARLPECPVSDDALWGAAPARFLHAREEMRLREAGLDPDTGEPDPYAGEVFD
ncbi:SMI1/KNR4 family protein [Streptomyces sp. NBC_01431]|uniref:SMI1/KNR4 family protein n=1 Tax=Streptomyces sp. NBC_01431 TaxID=2903863 RepID=UPI003FCDB5AA